jgi:hypothetical protein
MMVMMMRMVMMGWTMRLCAWNREGNGGDGGQSESKFSHEYYSLIRFPQCPKDGECVHPRQTHIL